MSTVKRYTLGVGVTEDSVVLVRKNRPAWQAGRLNFVGGKIEEGEQPIDCIVREFREETGVELSVDDWIYVGQMERPNDFVCYIYVSGHPDIGNVATMTDEEILVVNAHEFLISSDIQRDLISNIKTIFEFIVSADFVEQRAELLIKYPEHD